MSRILNGLLFIVTLNLKAPEGKEILKKLIAVSDVMIENFVPGAIERLNLGYDVVKEINPRIITARLRAIPTRANTASSPAMDGPVQATSGLALGFGA